MLNAWIFQASPNRFKIEDFLSARPANCKWMVTRHREEIRIGDVVYIWGSMGRRRNTQDEYLAGIAAEARVAGPVDDSIDDTSSGHYLIEKTDADDTIPRVLIEFIFIAPPHDRIRFEDALKDPILKNAKIFTDKNGRGTNFSLTTTESSQISRRWNGIKTRALSA